MSIHMTLSRVLCICSCYERQEERRIMGEVLRANNKWMTEWAAVALNGKDGSNA